MNEGAAAPRRSGAGWKLALRLLVTGAFLAWLISKMGGVDDVIPDQHKGLTLLLAMAVLVLAGFALRPSLIHEPHAWIALLIAGITLAILVIVLVAAGHPRIA